MLLDMDGGDHYGTSAANMTSSGYAQAGIPPSTSRPRNGTHSFRTTSTGAGLRNRKAFPNGVIDVVGIGAAFYMDVLPSDSNSVFLFQIANASNTNLMSVVLVSTGDIKITSGGAGGSILAQTVTPIYTANEFNHLELKATFNNGSGSVELRRNGVTIIDVNSINIGAPTAPAQWKIGMDAGSNGLGEFTYDDFYLWDDNGSLVNDFQGDKIVYLQLPNQDETAADFVRNTGSSDFGAIAEAVQDGDTTYLEATFVNAVSEFGLAPLPSEVTLIAGVKLFNFAKKTDSGVGTLTASLLSADVGSPPAESEAVGSDHALSESYAGYQDIIVADPATGAPFTPPAFNATRLRLLRSA